MAAKLPATASTPRVPGIDSLRFWLALWVYFSHFQFLPFDVWIGSSTPARHMLSGLSNNIFDGAGAVVVFFLISGLCIHYPYRSKPVDLLPFYTRRYIRILIPLGIALGLSRLMGNDLTRFYEAILWSLIAEEIYYAIYPMLRIFRQKFGWKVLLSASYLATVALVAAKPHSYFHRYGPGLTWLVGLPAWLLGCYLAETVEAATRQEVSTVRIWSWRLSMWALGSVASVLQFHAGIGYPITLTLMSPLLYYWLRLELGRKKRVPAFEYAGKFSYSIYLMHGIAVSILVSALKFRVPYLVADNAVASVLRLIFVLAFSYGFFLLIERPSHQFARQAARFVSQLGIRGWKLEPEPSKR